MLQLASSMSPIGVPDGKGKVAEEAFRVVESRTRKTVLKQNFIRFILVFFSAAAVESFFVTNSA